MGATVPLGSDPNGIILCLLTQNETTPLRQGNKRQKVEFRFDFL